MENKIAIVIINYIQFVNIKPGIDELISRGHTIDIYCPKGDKENEGYSNLFEDNVKILKKMGYNVYREVDTARKYKILLEPYPFMKIKAKYKIKYRYGTLSAKPNIVYGNPQNYIFYDAILCGGSYDANYLSNYAKTYITGNMKYINFTKKVKNKNNKKILLYLPTYGSCSSLDLIGEYLNNLRKNYYVIAKLHHGTAFLKKEHSRKINLEKSVDELYDLHKDLSELLSIADVVLSDNSGAIFEAIYAEVPVAIFSNDINQNKWGNFNTTQYELCKKGIIPYTNNLKEIPKIIEKALSPDIYQKQITWNRKNLYHPKDQIKDFVKIIEMYLSDQIDQRYFDFHTEYKKHYFELYEYKLQTPALINNQEIQIQNLTLNISHQKEETETLQKKLSEAENKLNKSEDKLIQKQTEIEELQKKLYYYETGKLYRIAKKIYNLKNGGKN